MSEISIILKLILKKKKPHIFFQSLYSQIQWRKRCKHSNVDINSAALPFVPSTGAIYHITTILPSARKKNQKCKCFLRGSIRPTYFGKNVFILIKIFGGELLTWKTVHDFDFFWLLFTTVAAAFLSAQHVRLKN